MVYVDSHEQAILDACRATPGISEHLLQKRSGLNNVSAATYIRAMQSEGLIQRHGKGYAVADELMEDEAAPREDVGSEEKADGDTGDDDKLSAEDQLEIARELSDTGEGDIPEPAPPPSRISKTASVNAQPSNIPAPKPSKSQNMKKVWADRYAGRAPIPNTRPKKKNALREIAPVVPVPVPDAAPPIIGPVAIAPVPKALPADTVYALPSVATLIRESIAQARGRGVKAITLDVDALDVLLG